MLLAGALVAGCQQQGGPPRSAPAPSQNEPAREREREPMHERNEARRPLKIEVGRNTDEPVTLQRDREPKKLAPLRPVDSWVIFRNAFESDKDATCLLRWVGGNQLAVKTQNISRLTIDMTKLPSGAPDRGPWVLEIDGQGIEITGFNPRPGYTGLKRDLVRSQNGVWSVDRKRLYRAGE